MKRFLLLGMVMLTAPLASAQNYQIDWYVIGSGGGHSASSNFQVDGTIGQPIVGQSSSTNYRVEAGFWVGSAQGGGCTYVDGDVNNDGLANGNDIVAMVNIMRGRYAAPYLCECTPGNTWAVSTDVNNSCGFNGNDVTYFVRKLRGQVQLMPCADCPPAGMIVSPGEKIPADTQHQIRPEKISSSRKLN